MSYCKFALLLGVLFIGGCSNSVQTWFGASTEKEGSAPSAQTVLSEINKKELYSVSADELAKLKADGLITDEELSMLKESL